LQKPIEAGPKPLKRGRSLLPLSTVINNAAISLYIEGRGVTQERPIFFNIATFLPLNKGAIDK